MTHGSLFSGIGGFDLAAHRMGWTNAFHCEINPFCRQVLKHYWPQAKSYEDITKADFTIHRGTIDVLTGGFPCQPFSLAGKRKGTEDDRYLWPEMLRAIREIKPRWIVGENVYGLVNWDGGLVFERVQADLENEGYEVQPYILPAGGVNAPHKRDRVWFVAYSNSEPGGEQLQQSGRKTPRTRKEFSRSNKLISPNAASTRREGGEVNTRGSQSQLTRAERSCETSVSANTSGGRLRRQANWLGKSGLIDQESEGNYWQNFPTQSPVRQRNDGISANMVRYITEDLYERISSTSEENRIQNMSEVWEKIQQEAVWEQVRGLYSLESKEILLQTMQLYSAYIDQQIQLSPFSQDFCQPIMQHLRKFGEFRCSPQGRKLEKQRSGKLADTMSFLPHEVALASGRFEAAVAKFDAWHRNESIKGYGNAIVPQVAVEIFKAIEQFEQ